MVEGGGTEETVYYYANGELVARKNNDETRTFYHTDHLGSTSVLTDENGDLVEATSYDPWGQVLSGGTQSRFQYTGKEKDSETGLNYYESRYYSSDIHRFVQPDTWLPNVYDPQQLNRYSYAGNNPLKYVDPTGHAIVFSGGKISSTYFPQPTPQKKPQTVQQFVNAGSQSSRPQSTASNTSSSSNNNSGSSGGGYQPQKDTGGATDVLKPAYNYVFGNDWKTLQNQNATFAQRGLAGVAILGNVVPPLKGAKAANAVEDVVGASKVFNPDQAALIDLAKEAEKSGVSIQDAKTLVEWAKEYGIKSHDIMRHENRAYWNFDHIKIFKSHIPINQ